MSNQKDNQPIQSQSELELELDSPRFQQSTRIESTTYFNDLPSLTPSKPTTSLSDSESDSISDRFTDEDEEETEQQQTQQQQEPENLIQSLNLNSNHISDRSIPHTQRTPSSQTSLSAISNNLISLSEPVPFRNLKINRKRSLSALVALRYRGGKADSEIGDEERGLLALDLDTYINSGETECIPETRALPPSALFPTLSTVIQANNNSNNNNNNTTIIKNTNIKVEQEKKKNNLSKKKSEIKLNKMNKKILNEEKLKEIVVNNNNDNNDNNIEGLLLPTPRSEWPFGGGTGPGKTSRGFIPGRSILHFDTNLILQNHLSHSDTVISSLDNSPSLN